jgi:hypothetical protein
VLRKCWKEEAFALRTHGRLLQYDGVLIEFARSVSAAASHLVRG